MKPQFQVHQLPKKHHMVLAELTVFHDHFMFLDDLKNFWHVIDTALAKFSRRDEIGYRVKVSSGKPSVSGCVPPCFLYPCTGCFWEDSLHGMAEQEFGYAIANLFFRRHLKHEFDQSIVKERKNIFKTKGCQLSVL